MSLEMDAGVDEAMGVTVEATLGAWVEWTSGELVGYVEEVTSCLEMEADKVTVAGADSNVETWIDAEEVLDSEMDENSCLLAEAEADAGELCATVEDDSCVLADAESEEL